MSRRQARFTENDLTRALKAARAINPTDCFVDIHPDGTISIGEQGHKPIRVEKQNRPPRSGAARLGFVYFIRAEKSAMIKIGFSEKPKKRLATLQTSLSEKLTLLATEEATTILEKKLHEKFAHLRERGEWFRPGPELLDYIKSVAL